MSILYHRQDEKPDFIVPYHKQRATDRYLTHYYNLLYLEFISKTTTNPNERRDAFAEMTKAEKALAHWEKHMNFNKVAALKGVEKLKKDWGK